MAPDRSCDEPDAASGVRTTCRVIVTMICGERFRHTSTWKPRSVRLMACLPTKLESPRIAPSVTSYGSGKRLDRSGWPPGAITASSICPCGCFETCAMVFVPSGEPLQSRWRS